MVLIMWQRRNYRHVLHSSVFWTLNVLVAAKHLSFVQRTFSRKAEHDILLSIFYWYKSWFHAQKSLNHYGTHSEKHPKEDWAYTRRSRTRRWQPWLPTYPSKIPAFLSGWCFGTWILFFHAVGNFIIPTDEVIFFRGVGQPPTSIFTITIH